MRASSSSFASSSTSRISGPCSMFLASYREPERGALLERSVRGHLTAVAMDDPLDGGEANAGTGELLGCVESLERTEQLRGVLHVEARAIVLDEVRRRAPDHGDTDLDPRGCMARRVLPRVADQVVQH